MTQNSTRLLNHVAKLFGALLGATLLTSAAYAQDENQQPTVTMKAGMKMWKEQLLEKPTVRFYIEDGVAIRRGKTRYVEAACESCHGPEGKSTIPMNPRLYKQRALYTRAQLVAFKNGVRTSGNAAAMTAMMSQLSDQDMWDIAYYLENVGSQYENQPEPPKGFTLPDTGQIQDVTEVFGEDSDYTINPPSYALNDDRTVTTDNNTKLMWQTAGQPGMSMPNGHDYCGSLTLGGFDDWRLPTIKELQTTASYRSTSPAADSRYFKNIPLGASGFWAGPRIPETVDTGWHIGYPDGHVMPYSAHANKFIRCVRADDGAMYLYNDFVDNGDGTVSDRVTDLTWQKEVDDDARRVWKVALHYCESLTLAGKSDWRLPNFIELISLVDYTDYDPALDESLFPNTHKDLFYWTSTSDIFPGADIIADDFVAPPQRNETLRPGKKTKSALAWGVSFQEGGGWRYRKEKFYYARCVR